MANRLFLLALLLCACSLAQDPAASEVAVFRSGVQLAVVQFHVTSYNRYVPGLTAADFLLVEDGRHVPISVFENGSLEGEALPVEVILLLDSSGSVSNKLLNEELLAAICLRVRACRFRSIIASHLTRMTGPDARPCPNSGRV
jgi:hypothetical protein